MAPRQHSASQPAAPGSIPSIPKYFSLRFIDGAAKKMSIEPIQYCEWYACTTKKFTHSFDSNRLNAAHFFHQLPQSPRSFIFPPKSSQHFAGLEQFSKIQFSKSARTYFGPNFRSLMSSSEFNQFHLEFMNLSLAERKLKLPLLLQLRSML